MQLFFDDANSPSLLSLPYIGWVPQDNSLYRTTRNFVLSDANPFFFRGTAGEGIGSPHVPWRFVWPMSIVMRALTSSSDDEILQCLTMLRDTTAGNFAAHGPLQLWLDVSYSPRHRVHARELQHQQRKRFYQALVCLGQHSFWRSCFETVSGASLAYFWARCHVDQRHIPLDTQCSLHV